MRLNPSSHLPTGNGTHRRHARDTDNSRQSHADRLIVSLTPRIETLIQERLTVSFADMKRIDAPKVSGKTSTLRLLTPQKVSHQTVRPESETTGDNTNLARISVLLNEDRTRKPAEIQRLTGIPKTTVYRLVERYHRDNPVIETRGTSETESDETMRHETETAS